VRTYNWNGNTNIPLTLPEMTDFQVACKVRMLLRSDLDFEPVVCMARERIMCLQEENALLTKKLAGLEDIDEVSAGYRDLCKKAIDALSEYSFRDDFQKEFDKLKKEFEELGK